ncbi:Angiopoietin-related protein 1 [Stylophora pistillata]|uniref:Angiopoietin-related protein 1 n=1 Tax=Stylophora pistillata TaxID=50429 RepID=A0A2B4SNU0_STYPI|nr:Angiopoietin-related protein 1 [Stylophora pistillata]
MIPTQLYKITEGPYWSMTNRLLHSQEPSVYNVTMDVVVEIFIVSTMGPAKKPVTEEDSDVRASQVIQDRTAIKECKGFSLFEFCRENSKREKPWERGLTLFGEIRFSVSKSCAEIKKRGGSSDGVYAIDPDGKGGFQIYCNQINSAGEPWTVIQRRMDGSVDFYRGWTDYKKGFGNLQREFWLGLEKIHRLTDQRQQKLRVEIRDFKRYWCWAEYENFTVSGEDDGFRLQSVGSYTGSCIDSFSYNVGARFSTKDKDEDNNASSHCAVDHQGGWWYKACTQCNLNGNYNLTGLAITGIYWYQNNKTPARLKWVEIKLQPLG